MFRKTLFSLLLRMASQCCPFAGLSATQQPSALLGPDDQGAVRRKSTGSLTSGSPARTVVKPAQQLHFSLSSPQQDMGCLHSVGSPVRVLQVSVLTEAASAELKSKS